MQNRKKIKFLILTLTILLLAREAGYIRLFLASSGFNNRIQTNLAAEFDYGNNALIGRKVTGDFTKMTTDDFMSLHLEFRKLSRINLFTNISKQLKKDFEAKADVSVTVRNIDLAGLYWLPLYKTGFCEYNIDISALNSKSRVLNGTVKGKIDFYFVGISSITDLKEKLSERIAKDVIQNIEEDVK
jgi:hypothetical protein